MSLQPMPGWSLDRRPASPEEAAFLSGAATAHLQLTLNHPTLPHALWRDRLALQAAADCVGIIGRPEGLADLRDVLHLARAGDPLGPAGEISRSWRGAVARPISPTALAPMLNAIDAAQVASCLAMRG